MDASRRTLTKDSDILPALSGLANIIHRRINDKYLAGIWLRDLLSSLFWRVVSHYPPKTRPHYRAPTWSWASIIGEVAYTGVVENGSQNEAFGINVLNTKVNLAGLDPFGEVSGATIPLSGWFSRPLSVEHMYDSVSAEGYVGSSINDGSRPLGEDVPTLDGLMCDVTPDCIFEQEIICLRRYKAAGIAIMLSPIKGIPDMFRRIGFIDPCDENWGFVPRTITII